MDFNQNLPIYIQIMNLIKDKMASGEICGGDKLASVREFSKELKVNPNTVQRAYQELEREQLVSTRRGMGTFITDDEKIIKDLKRAMAGDVIESFLNKMEKLGFTPNEIIHILSKRMEGK